MNVIKKELAVAALENGTVIDHIPTQVLFKVVDLLKLANINNSVTIGNNLDSEELGKKGIIKIADVFFPEQVLNRIALIAPSAKINVIKDYSIVEKYNVTLPDEIIDIVKCNNPKCITNNEPMKTKFHVVDRDNMILQCHYCERCMTKEDIELK